MICKKCKRENFDIHSSDNHIILKCKVCKTIHTKFDHSNYCCIHKNLKIVKCQMADGRFFKSNMCINCLKNFGNVKKTENEYMYVGYEERQELREKIQTEYYSLFKSVMENKKYFGSTFSIYSSRKSQNIRNKTRRNTLPLFSLLDFSCTTRYIRATRMTGSRYRRERD